MRPGVRTQSSALPTTVDTFVCGNRKNERAGVYYFCCTCTYLISVVVFFVVGTMSKLVHAEA